MTLLGTLALAVPAQAGVSVAGSLGKGITTNPTAVAPTTIMIAPGWAPIDLIRLELGIIGDLGDVREKKFNLHIRPSVIVDVPILPVYARIIIGADNLLDRTTFAYGGGVGVDIGLGPITAFAEIDVLPRTENKTVQLDLRIGVMLGD